MTNERYHYGLGRRKSAVARVRLYPGAGNVIINGKQFEDVIPRASSRIVASSRLKYTSDSGRSAFSWSSVFCAKI